jgi:hypothetical protein
LNISGEQILDISCGIGVLISLLKEIVIRKIAATEHDPDAADFVGQSQDVEVSVYKVDRYPV